MSLLGFDAIGRWAIGHPPDPSGAGPSYALLAASGAAALSGKSGPASGSLSAAGTASFTGVSGPASGALQAAGAGTLSGNLTAKGSSVVAMGGAGAAAMAIFSKNLSTMSAAGTGVFSPKVQAKVSATVSMQGHGNLGDADRPGSVASFAGVGGFVAVLYGFFADADKCGPPTEPRTATVPSNRISPAVVPFENRVYDVAGKQRSAKPPNRRRTL